MFSVFVLVEIEEVYIESKNQLLRSLDDQNEEPKLRKLGKDIVATANRLAWGQWASVEKQPY